MSTDEQMAAIGRLLTERVGLKREAALLERQIKDAGRTLYQAGVLLGASPELSTRTVEASVPDALNVIRGMISSGGLDQLSKTMADYNTATRRIAELTKSLKEAGAE